MVTRVSRHSSDAATSSRETVPQVDVESSALILPRLYAEWLSVLLGRSGIEIPAKDSRFADPAWQENPLYRRLGQGYIAFCNATDKLAGRSKGLRERERARFLAGILTSSVSPTNTLLGNPAALRKALDTRGVSLAKGVKHFADDLLRNKGMPSQVRKSDFEVGRNLATTPGAVVFRNDMVEVIQYQPTTKKVAERPTLVIVPPIGKYYFMDMAPGRSFMEFATSRGVQMFVTSWRNPGPQQGQWGVNDYVRTCLQAVDAVCDVSGSDRLNLIGMCAGGILSTLLLGVMQGRGDMRVGALTLAVTLLEYDSGVPISGFNAKPVTALARKHSEWKGVLPANHLANVFAWMRPNDLVWNYWVNNYLLGKEPPSFDILAWNADGTNLPAKLHADFLDIFENNSFVKPGSLTVLGVPIDPGKIRIDKLITGALTDHLTPWKGCYRTTQILGGKSTFVLSNAGHIASIINPPGNSRASYWVGPKPAADPDAWFAASTRHTGTWWEVWSDWTLKRSGSLLPASKGPGSAAYPALDAAPGKYVFEKA